MEHINLLGRSFDCSCGKSHHVPTRYLYYSRNAFDSLAATSEEVTQGKKYLVVADKRTYEAAGRVVKDRLQEGSAEVFTLIVPDVDGESPVADDITRDWILSQAPPADLYVAVGSGVINDLVKWISYLQKKPYIIVATAASMNGYASANVAASIDGLKVLFHADACEAVFVDPDILGGAPFELTASGLGDVLAKSVSSADWKLNQFLFGDYYCQFSVDLLKELEPVYLEAPENIRKRQPAAIKALFEALFFSSIAMTITGTSSPASGGEHLISHTLDMVADRDGRKHDLHGRQVGVSSILMAALYDRVMSLDRPVFHDVPATINKEFWGTLSPVIEKEYRRKLPKFERTREILHNGENWARFKELIKPGLVSAEKLKNCLRKGGGAYRYSDLRDNDQPLVKEKFIATVIHAHQMRERFTILDMAVLLGLIPQEIERLIEEWVTKE